MNENEYDQILILLIFCKKCSKPQTEGVAQQMTESE